MTPQNAAGRTTEPSVCVPSAAGTSPTATAAAEPLDEPPGVWSSFQGLRVRPGWRHANSVVTVLPNSNADAPDSASTTQADRSGTWPANAAEPIPVGTSRVSMMSL